MTIIPVSAEGLRLYVLPNVPVPAPSGGVPASASPVLAYIPDSSGTGGEGSPGSATAPFKTLEAARDAIRTATGRTTMSGPPPASWEGATVILLDGGFSRTSAFVLDGRDSGTQAFPIVYQAAAGATVTVTGAYPVAENLWTRVTSADTFAWSRLPAATRSQTYVLNVSALGIDKGENGSSGFAYCRDQLLLISNGTLVPRAAFPNGNLKDASSWLDLAAATDGGTNAAATFTVASSAPAGWDETGQDIYGYGFFGEPWATAWERLSSISASGSSSVATIPTRTGSYAVAGADGHFMRFSNVMEAMTAGHHVWAQTQGKLYYLPSSGEPTGTSLTLLSTVMTLGADENSAKATNHVRFENLTFEGTRDKQVVVYRSTNVTFSGCTFRSGSGSGPTFEDVTNCHLANCTVSGFMEEGSRWDNVGNGSKATLTKSGCSVTGSTFSGNGWGLQSQNKAALSIPGNGCGFDVRGCTFRNNYSRSILSDSALVRIDQCNFDGDVIMTGDAGAVSNGRKLTDVGMEVTNCTFANIRRHPCHNNSLGAVFAIYMDDGMSWATITDNTFTNCDSAMQLASGKGLVVRRNKFTDCSKGHHLAPVVFSDRSGFNIATQLEADLAAYSLTAAPWSTQWPLLKDLRPGASLRAPTDYLRRFHGLVFVDNMATDGIALARAVAAVVPYVDLTQLNYPLGATGTPVDGGGRVKLSDVDRQ